MAAVLTRLLVALSLMIFLAPPATAQVALPQADSAPSAATLPDPLTPEAVREMVSRLSDAEVRSMLLGRLDALAEEAAQSDETTSDSLVEFAEKATTGVYESVSDAVGKVPLLWELQMKSFRGFRDILGENGLLVLTLGMTAGILSGLLAEYLFLRATRRWHAVDMSQHDGSLRGSIRFLFNRFCGDIFGVIVFFVVAEQVGPAVAGMVGGAVGYTNGAAMNPYAWLIWTNLIVMPRIAAATSRFLLAPQRPEFRIVHTDDATARYLHRNWIGFFILIGFTMTIFTFNDMNGVRMGESRLGFWLNLAIHAYIVIAALRVWDGLVMSMRGADPEVTPMEERVAQAYPWFCIIVSVGTWYMVEVIVAYEMFALLAGAPHVWMMVILIMAPALDTMVRGLVRHLVPPMTGEGELARRAHLSTKRSFIRIGRLIVFALVLISIARIWGIDMSNLAAAGIGAQVAGRMIEILMILAIGYLVWELVSLWINRKLASEQTAAMIDPNDEEPGGGEGGQAGGSRLSTVLPLTLGVMKAAIAIIFGLIALGNIGIDITPLLAGAGIVGLAIGFGAQKLVADVVSGIFFLVDDAFRTGEYVEIEGTFGTVEKISIRSMQLRHHKGPVHTIPYGEIPKITNFSRDWVIMKLKFTVPFDTDPNTVKKIFKQIGKDMMTVPEFEKDLLQPFKSQGVFDFDDVGMIIRGKFMAKPGRQFVLRKEIYNRVKAAFESNGIEFARREVRIAIPGLDGEQDLTDEQKRAVATGAAQAAQDAVETSVP
ncbi:MAG: mechanosensitive ion channel domain-containing protein [Pseudomonadota bacterium]